MRPPKKSRSYTHKTQGRLRPGTRQGRKIDRQKRTRNFLPVPSHNTLQTSCDVARRRPTSSRRYRRATTGLTVVSLRRPQASRRSRKGMVPVAALTRSQQGRRPALPPSQDSSSYQHKHQGRHEAASRLGMGRMLAGAPDGSLMSLDGDQRELGSCRSCSQNGDSDQQESLSNPRR